MEITDVRVKLIQEPNDRLKAVCSITFDGIFVVRDLKVVDGSQGLFVAMPSRKLTSHCPRCGSKNHLRARFCNECGSKVPPGRMPAEGNGRTKLHRDIAHPITSEFRELIQARVIEGFQQELELSKQPGYTPKDLDKDLDEAEEQVEAAGRGAEYEPTEYDALIAGLRGRERPVEAAPPTRGERREGGRPQESRRGQDGGRGREGGHGESRRPRPERSGPPRGESRGARGGERREAPPARPAPPPPPPPPVAKPAPAAVETVEENDEPFGAGLV
jgi:DNA-binding cell septation regulator SpoVG